MRTLRLSLMGTVILALLGGLGSVALAQDDEDPSAAPAPATAASEMKPVLVTGEEVCDDTGCQYTLSDPRVSGKALVVWDDEASVPGGFVSWGRLRLPGPKGVWAGPWVGTQIAESTTDILVTLEGNGAYEGWAFVFKSSGQMDGRPLEVKGVLYEGSAPPLLPAE